MPYRNAKVNVNKARLNLAKKKHETLSCVGSALDFTQSRLRQASNLGGQSGVNVRVNGLLNAKEKREIEEDER